MPATIPAGKYMLIVSTLRPSDVPTATNPAASRDYGGDQCWLRVTISPTWSSVAIAVTFDQDTCRIEIHSS